ncbi:hypothetical protein NDU88_001546 [Pleurodeles waltl]|uniref:ZP domain-containing protein n=1 Tax=Pleurodeles waltl TaxID=8319 RepID=A0AAV7TJ02_PLEWA|nr:hypothetical protein NDU88_001546 [Pleurodeles waltl]
MLLECFNQAHLQMMAQSAAFCNLVDGDFIPRTGYGVCSCKRGSVGDGFTCTKMALCTLDSCCMPGYKWNTAVSPKACTTVNQCPSDNPLVNKCTPPSTCNEINGLYTCVNNKMAACVNGLPCSDPQKDCLRATLNGDLQCADPCDYYDTVDGTARLSSSESRGRFPTDRYMYGWNRYVGSKGVMMKEGCLGSGLKCGSGEPFTLNEAHPTLSEGIKPVRLQTNTANGCLLSGFIWIKACPRGFYVYKFTGSPTFEVFCTGLSSIGRTTSLQCLESTIKLSVRKCLLESLNINTSALQLDACGSESAIIDGKRQITFTVPKASRTCGLSLSSNGTHALYSGTLALVPSVYGNILLQDRTGLHFKCAYPLNVDVNSLDAMEVTSLPEVIIEVASAGRTAVDIAVYKHSDFTSPLLGSDSVSTSTPLYVMIEAKDLDPDRFTLMINSFWASPSSSTDPTDPIYTNYFMNDGCLYNDTVPVTLLGSSSSLQKKFQFNAFRFSGSNTIYLHSSVSLCDMTNSTCLHNCGASRRRREAIQESQAVITTFFRIADDWAVLPLGGR